MTGIDMILIARSLDAVSRSDVVLGVLDDGGTLICLVELTGGARCSRIAIDL